MKKRKTKRPVHAHHGWPVLPQFWSDKKVQTASMNAQAESLLWSQVLAHQLTNGNERKI